MAVAVAVVVVVVVVVVAFRCKCYPCTSVPRSVYETRTYTIVSGRRIGLGTELGRETTLTCRRAGLRSPGTAARCTAPATLARALTPLLRFWVICREKPRLPIAQILMMSSTARRTWAAEASAVSVGVLFVVETGMDRRAGNNSSRSGV